jgi:hypothetical protein
MSMRRTLLAILLAATATPSSAAVEILFNNPTGNLGSTETYTSGAMTIDAAGYSANGTPSDLWGKNDATADEKGLGMADDPQNDHEIFGPGSAFVELDVTQILALASGMSFFMGSTTDGEQWSVYGSDAAGTLGTLLFSGNDQLTWHELTGWGDWDYYQWTADGTIGSRVTAGNVLLGGVSITESVPEPGTWAMMLLGFGAAGFALRRRKRTELAFRHAA